MFCTAVITKHGYRSVYDVNKLLIGRQRTFNNVELVVASCTTSSSARGTIQLIANGSVMNEWSEMLLAPTARQDGYDRFNLTLFFDNIRQRLSATSCLNRFSESKAWSKGVVWVSGTFSQGRVNPLKGKGVNWLYLAVQVWPTFLISDIRQSGAQGWAPEWPNVRN